MEQVGVWVELFGQQQLTNSGVVLISIVRAHKSRHYSSRPGESSGNTKRAFYRSSDAKGKLVGAIGDGRAHATGFE